ncbi:MAG: Gfo/Idh/MocA family oxidoreductase [bacterium]
MANKKFKVGVIGVGGIAQDRHLPYWRELEEEGRVQLVGVCDINKERLQKVAEKYETKKNYASAARMLSNGEYDIIDICTPNRWHAPYTIMALETGAHVLVEKPMAMNAEESRQMIQASKKAKRTLMVAQHMRFESQHERLKEVIQRGELGEVYFADATILRRRGIPGWGQFHIKKESLGGPLIDLGVHIIDMAVWLMGNPKPIAASGKVYRMFGDRKDLCNADWGHGYPPKEYDVEDFAAAFIRFKNNITLSVKVSWAANIAEEVEGLSILGDKGGASTNPLKIYGYRNDALTTLNFDWLPEQEGHRMEIRHFTECLEKKHPVRVQPDESLQIQKILDAIYESSKRNREVVIR